MGDTRPPFLCRDGNRDGDGDGLPSPDQARQAKPTSQAKPQSHVNVNENCNCRAAGSELNWAGLVAQCDNEICSRQRNGFLTLTGHCPLAELGRKRSSVSVRVAAVDGVCCQCLSTRSHVVGGGITTATQESLS